MLKELGVEEIDRNEEGKRKAHPDRRVLFFMPHCDMWLYSNVLWANKDDEGSLDRVTIIGNAFSTTLTARCAQSTAMTRPTAFALHRQGLAIRDPCRRRWHVRTACASQRRPSGKHRACLQRPVRPHLSGGRQTAPSRACLGW